MSDYLENPQKVHSDIINALKAVAVLIVPAAGLFLFNIAIFSYKSAYFATFHLPFIPLESSLWVDVVQNKTLVVLLLTLLFFAIGLIVGGIFMFRHSLEKVANQEFSWPIFIATFALLSPFIFTLQGISTLTKIVVVVLYTFVIPFAFTKHFHDFLHSLRSFLPKKMFLEKKEQVVLHDISFIILGITYLFIIFILFILLMEFVAGQLGHHRARDTEQVMISGEFIKMPEHVVVKGISMYLEGCDSRKCLGYERLTWGDDVVIQPHFFSVTDINFINPEILVEQSIELEVDIEPTVEE